MWCVELILLAGEQSRLHSGLSAPIVAMGGMLFDVLMPDFIGMLVVVVGVVGTNRRALVAIVLVPS